MTQQEQKERENFLRHAIRVVDHSKEALIFLFDLDLQNKHLTFEQFLNQNQHDIYHLCYNNVKCCRCSPGYVPISRNRVLFPAQLDILFDKHSKLTGHNSSRRSSDICCSKAKSGISTNVLDLTLTRCLLVNFCIDVFWNSCLQSQGINLEQFLNTNKHVIYHLWQYNTPCCLCPNYFKFPSSQQLIVSSEWNNIFTASTVPCSIHRKRANPGTVNTICSVSATPGITVSQLNLTLQQKILEFCCSVRKSLDVLVDIRNQGYGHINEAKISDVEYQRYKKDIEDAITEIARVCGNEQEVKQKLLDVEIRTLDMAVLVQYQTSMLEIYNRNNDVLKEISGLSSLVETNTNAVEHVRSKIQKMEDRLESMEAEIPKNVQEYIEQSGLTKRSRLIGLTKTEIEDHIENGTFVETAAVKECVNLLEAKSFLILTGAAGTGKSRNSLEILRQFRRKHTEYEVVKVTDLNDFTDIIIPECKHLILFEDVFGRTNNKFSENTDIQVIDRLNACVRKGNVKVILTIRDTIRMSCEWLLTSHPMFHTKCEVDLSSAKFQMSSTEKEQLMINYFRANNFKLLDSNEVENYMEEKILDTNNQVTLNRVTFHAIVKSDPLLGFPEACCLFTGNRKLTRLGLSFFKHPSKYLYEEIEKLRKNGKSNQSERMNYVTLVYIFLNEDSLDIKSIDTKRGLEILKSCYNTSHRSLKKIDIKDAAKVMIGRYLTYVPETSSYHFQHQTILESVMISYSKINQKQILSKISFDFLREMVRLQTYQKKEGEVVMKIYAKNYRKLSKRIMEIVQSEYFNRSRPLNMQLLCDSEIIRPGDLQFLRYLIEESQQVYSSSQYQLQTIITDKGHCRLLRFYFPAAILQCIAGQTGMESIFIYFLNHIESFIKSKNDDDLYLVCKSAVLEAFVQACDIENNDLMLDMLWTTIKELDAPEENWVYCKTVIDKVCSRCPLTTMIWLLKNIDHNILDMKSVLNKACEFNRLDLVQFLCKSMSNINFNFTEAFLAAVNNVFNDPDEEISSWLLTNVDHTCFDMRKISRSICELGCAKDIKTLLQNVDHSALDMSVIFNIENTYKQKSGSTESLLRWILSTISPRKLDPKGMMDVICKLKVFELVPLLFRVIDVELLDVNMLIISAVTTDWQGENITLINWILSNIDIKLLDLNCVILETCKNGSLEEMKLLIKNVCQTDLDLNNIMFESCANGHLNIVQYMFTEIDLARVDFETLLESCCNFKNTDTLHFLLEKIKENKIDVHCDFVLIESCRFGWISIVNWLLENVDHELMNVKAAMDAVVHFQFEEPDFTVIKLLLQKVNHNKFDMNAIIKEASFWGLTNIIIWIWQNTDITSVDMKSVMNIACERCHYDLVSCILLNIDHSAFDMISALHHAMNVQDGKPDNNLIILLLEHSLQDQCLLDMTYILSKACYLELFDTVNWLLKHLKYDLVNIKSAIQFVLDINLNKVPNKLIITNLLESIESSSCIVQDIIISACHKKSYDVAKWLIYNIDHLLLNLKETMIESCKRGCCETVEWLLGNVDLSQFDMEEAMYKALHGDLINDNEIERKVLISLILKRVDYKLFDVNEVMNEACSRNWIDIVKWLLENVDHSMLDMKRAMNEALQSDYDDMYTGTSTINLILKKVDHNLFDVKDVMNVACCKKWFRIVKWLLENVDHSLFDMKKAMNEALQDDYVCDDDMDTGTSTINLILKKVDHNSFDVKEIMNVACSKKRFSTVKWLLENVDHSLFDMKKAMNEALHMRFSHYGRKLTGELLINLLLKKVHHNLFDVKDVMNVACSNNWFSIVKWLLENVNHSLLDMKKAMNEVLQGNYVCDNDMDTGIYTINLILKKVDHNLFDVKDVMNVACSEKWFRIVKWLLENVDHSLFDMKKAMHEALQDDYMIHADIDTCISTIILILKKVDHNLFDVKDVMNVACSKKWFRIVKWLVENVDHSLFDMKKALNEALQGHYMIHADIDTWISTINLILKKVDHNLFDVKDVMNVACSNNWFSVVKWLLENVDHSLLDMKKAMNEALQGDYVCDDDMDTGTSTIILILKKVDHNLFDLNEVMIVACSKKRFSTVKWLLENVDHSLFDMKNVMNEALNIKYLLYGMERKCELLINLILEKVDHNLFDVKDVMNVACSANLFHTVKWLLANVDHSLFDMKKVMNLETLHSDYLCDGDVDTGEPLNNLYLETGDHNLIDVKDIMNVACSDVKDVMNVACSKKRFSTVKWILENVDHSLLDMKKAMNEALHIQFSHYGRKLTCELLINLLLKKVDHNLFDVKEIMNVACSNNWFSIVKWLLENVDHSLFDLKKAMNEALQGDYVYDYHIDKGTSAITLILKKVDHNLFDVKEIMIVACCNNWFSIVKWLLKNVDHSLLDMKKAMNEALQGDYDDIYIGTSTITLILKKVDHNLFDVKEIMNVACSMKWFSTVKWLLKNVDHSLLDMKKAMNGALQSDYVSDDDRDTGTSTINLILKKVDHNLFDVKEIMNVACNNNWFSIVKWLLMNVDHSLFDINSALCKALSYSISRIDIFVYILENIDHSLMDIEKVSDYVCHLNHTNGIVWLFNNIECNYLNLKNIMNEACVNNNLDIVQMLWKTAETNQYDMRAAMNKACRSKHLDTVKWLSENVSQQSFDMKTAMNNACRVDNYKTVKWFLKTVNVEEFDIHEAFSTACRNGSISTVECLMKHIDRKVLNITNAVKEACKLRYNGLDMVKLILGPSVKDDPKLAQIAIYEACRHGQIYIVEWLMTNTITDTLDLKIVITASIRSLEEKTLFSDADRDNDLNHKMSILLLILKKSKDINMFGLSVLSKVMETACRYGKLDVVKLLLSTLGSNKLDIRHAVNCACQYGKLDIVKWFIENVELRALDVQTIINESCGYGWIDVIKFLWSGVDTNIINVTEMMDDACLFGRLEIVKWLIDNVNMRKFDSGTVINGACRHGWLDILNWGLQNLVYDLNNIRTGILEACTNGKLEALQLLFLKLTPEPSEFKAITNNACTHRNNEDIMNFLLNKFDMKLFDLGVVLKKSCENGWYKIIEQIIDNITPDCAVLSESFNIACKNGEIDTVKLFVKKINKNEFDLKLAMTNVCGQGWDEIVQFMLNELDHGQFDLTAAMNEACRHGELHVVELLYEKCDRNLFDMQTALNGACRSYLNEDLVEFLIKHIDCLNFDTEAVMNKAREHSWNKIVSIIRRLTRS